MTKALVIQAVRVYDLLTIPDNEVSPSNALQATGKALRFGMWASLATLAVFVVGGALAPLQSASALRGSIVPSDYKKTVQHLEGGIIDQILVKDSEQVTEGQPLIRLRSVGPSASQGIAAVQYFTTRVSQARVEALQNGKDEMTLASDLKEEAAVNPQFQDIVTSQQRLFASDRDAQRDKIAMYTQQIAQLHADSDGLQARLKSAKAQLGFVDEALHTERGLVAQGFSTRPRLLTLQGQDEDLQGRVGDLTAALGKNQQSEKEIQAKISNAKDEFNAKNEEELRNDRESAIELQKKLAAASDVLDRTVITAPISGIVNDLRFHTVGGVIPPGAAVMDIVPGDGLLLVDAEVPPRNISRVHVGQDAKLMFPSYRSRETPMVMGKVVQVSPDRILPPSSSGMAMATPSNGHFLARVEVSKADLAKLASPITLTPGMPVEVMVIDGEHSLLSYYFQPLFESLHHAFREQ